MDEVLYDTGKKVNIACLYRAPVLEENEVGLYRIDCVVVTKLLVQNPVLKVGGSERCSLNIRMRRIN